MKIGDIVVCLDKVFEDIITLGQQVKVEQIITDSMGNYYLQLEGYPDAIFPEGAFSIVDIESAENPEVEIFRQLSHWRDAWIEAQNDDDEDAAEKCIRYLNFFLDKLNVHRAFDKKVS